MSDKYLEMPTASFQKLVTRMEDQTGKIPFHRLCVMLSDSLWGREYKFTPGLVRLRIIGEKIVTQTPLPERISLNNLADRLNPRARRPFCVSYGMGVDSTAMLIHLARMYDHGKRPEYRPDMITFADTGNEKKETYQYLPVMNAYLKSVGFPEITVINYEPSWTKNGDYYTLEQNCLVNRTLPSLAFGFKKCSNKWKITPQNKYREQQPMCQQAWAAGLACIVAIGYDAGPKDSCRSWDITDDEHYEYCYPLIELGWDRDRDRCIAEIQAEGLPGYETDHGGKWLKKGGVPVKSACWYCPSTQPEELVAFSKTEHGQEYLRAIIRMEKNAAPNLTTIEGLWRNGVKGTRGGKAKPGSMTKYIIDNKLLGDKPRVALPLAEQFTFTNPEQVAGVF